MWQSRRPSSHPSSSLPILSSPNSPPHTACSTCAVHFPPPCRCFCHPFQLECRPLASSARHLGAIFCSFLWSLLPEAEAPAFPFLWLVRACGLLDSSAWCLLGTWYIFMDGINSFCLVIVVCTLSSSRGRGGVHCRQWLCFLIAQPPVPS